MVVLDLALATVLYPSCRKPRFFCALRAWRIQSKGVARSAHAAAAMAVWRKRSWGGLPP